MPRLKQKFIKAARLLTHPRYIAALSRGVPAAIEHRRVLNYLNGQGVGNILDIGANLGQFSLVSRNCIPDANIIAFEPLEPAARKYETVFRNDPKVRLIRAAVGAESAQMEMHVSRAPDSSSLLPISPTQSRIFPGTEESHMVSVRVAPLGALVPPREIPRRSLLKIDVQGYELRVLTGCEDLLDRFFAVYVECSFIELYHGQALAHEVIDWLHRRGFQLTQIGALTFDREGLSVQGDFLFMST